MPDASPGQCTFGVKKRHQTSPTRPRIRGFAQETTANWIWGLSRLEGKAASRALRKGEGLMDDAARHREANIKRTPRPYALAPEAQGIESQNWYAQVFDVCSACARGSWGCCLGFVAVVR